MNQSHYASFCHSEPPRAVKNLVFGGKPETLRLRFRVTKWGIAIRDYVQLFIRDYAAASATTAKKRFWDVPTQLQSRESFPTSPNLYYATGEGNWLVLFCRDFLEIYEAEIPPRGVLFFLEK